jgi:hypothetical protein
MGNKKDKPKFDRVLGNLGSISVSIGGIIGAGIFFIIGIATGNNCTYYFLQFCLLGF